MNNNIDDIDDDNDNGYIIDYDELKNKMDDSRKYEILTVENVFYVLIGCLGAIILVIAILIFIYFRSIKKSASPLFITEPLQTLVPKSQNSTKKLLANSFETYALMTKNVTKVSNYTNPNQPCSSNTLIRRPSIAPSIVPEKSQVINVKKAFMELHTDRNLIEILPMKELQGTFGEMKWAMWRKKSATVMIDHLNDGVEGSNRYCKERIIVKGLKVTVTDQRYLGKFLLDALAFFNVQPHKNLAQVAAVASCNRCDNPEQRIDFPLICYSHDGFGNLKKFLITFRNDQTTNVPFKSLIGNGIQTLSAQELVSVALQILNAVIHLHNCGIIHKDIATRNCLISKNHNDDQLFVQICDAALSKDFFPDDYYCLGDNENRPMKWMAYESLIHNSFNSSTDVWSFGVTLWELLTCAQQPYPEIDPDEMATILECGKRLPQPYNCPDELYELMYCCWQLDYRDRPTAQQLRIELREFNLQLLQYI